ncbi:DUF6125 family protein [[Eubacterium] cellulosolvens]
MLANRDWDKKRLMGASKEALIEQLFLHVRNIWSEDGLYFLGIEKRFGTDAAIEIDKEVWAAMGKTEARRLKRMLKLSGDGILEVLEALKHTSWWLDNKNMEFEANEISAIIRIKDCYVQHARTKKGLGEFNCKPVRKGFLCNFVREFNPDIEVQCNFAPLDKHPVDAYCEWKFLLKE